MTNTNEGKTHYDPVAEAEGKMRNLALKYFRLVHGTGDAGSEAEFNRLNGAEKDGWLLLAAQSAETIARLEADLQTLVNDLGSSLHREHDLQKKLAAVRVAAEIGKAMP